MSITRKIRVLQTIRQGLVGGGESHVLGLVEELDKSRFEPFVLSFTDGPMITRLQKMGIPSFVIPSVKAFDIRLWYKVRQLLQKEKVSLVHAHGSRAASNLLMPARSLRIPMLYTIHGWSFHEDQPFLKKSARVFSEKLLTGSTHCNISVSASNQRTGKQHFSSFRSVVIPNGINLRRFDHEGRFSDIRAELQIPAHHTLIGYIARITLQKDPFTLIHAFHEALQETKDMTLLVVGEGDLKADMMQLAEELGVTKHIVFQDFREDIPDILHATDIYCLPSLWEGLPIGLLEAMAMNNAVIATNVDGSKEIIEHMWNGWIMEPGDRKHLAAAIVRLHKDKLLRSQLQRAALQTIRQGFSVDGMARQVEELYLNILQQPQGKTQKS